MVQELLDKIGSLTIVQAAELVKAMEDKFGISAAAPVAVAAVAAPAAGAAAAEEKTEFNVVLEGFSGDKKVDAIKKVREITNLPLMDAKKLVEGGTGVLKEGVAKEEAEKIKKKIESLGRKTPLKSCLFPLLPISGLALPVFNRRAFIFFVLISRGAKCQSRKL